MKERLKAWIFRLLGKEPEAVVVTFCSGDAELCRRMADEVRALLPGRRHFLVDRPQGGTLRTWLALRRQFRHYRIGLAPVMLGGEPRALRRAAWLLAPRKILAYNTRLERHHLRPDIESLLFWRGVPLDRSRLRPRWWPWSTGRTVTPAGHLTIEGRPFSGRPRIAVLSPYYPYPLAHGGAVRIFNLLREMAQEFDIHLFAFASAEELAQYGFTHAASVASGPPPPASAASHPPSPASQASEVPNPASAASAIPHPASAASQPPSPASQASQPPNPASVASQTPAAFCSRITLVGAPRYREPQWSTLLPPQVREFASPAMREALASAHFDLLQVEYTQLAAYGGDILVEHDVTFDLFNQIRRRNRTFSAWWDWYRWQRFERRQARRYASVVAMSPKDAKLLGSGVRTTVIENGVDLERYQPRPETPGERLLFIGSFRHFPNILAYRFFIERVWPALRECFPHMTLTVVCGPDYLTYWRGFTDSAAPAPDDRVRLLGFVADVRPLYEEANLVIVPTTVSAGTNLKVLEAMAMERAVVSTSSGCAGLGLEHGSTVWVADEPAAFGQGVAVLASEPARRAAIARAARGHALRSFGWAALGEKQRALLRRLLAAKRA
jgi:glycosyltransferase involved in cell wall biosynthesis